jgi:hypothetical protein
MSSQLFVLPNFATSNKCYIVFKFKPTNAQDY